MTGRATFHELDITSAETPRLVREGGFDVVALLAAQIDVRKSVAIPTFDAQVNVVGTVNLLEALRRLGSAPPEQRAALEQLSRALVNKFLHAPTVRLRAAAAEGRGLAIAEAARYLFALDREPEASDASPDGPERVPVSTHAPAHAHGEEQE